MDTFQTSAHSVVGDEMKHGYRMMDFGRNGASEDMKELEQLTVSRKVSVGADKKKRRELTRPPQWCPGRTIMQVRERWRRSGSGIHTCRVDK